MTSKIPTLPRASWRRWLIVLVLVAALYGLLPQLGSFHDSLHLLHQLQWGWAGWALLTTLLTYAAAALTYCLLAFKPLPYARTLFVQPACMFINRLLPAGIGGIGANYVYLRKQRHNQAQAASMVAMNNLLGLIGHLLLVALLLVFFGSHIPTLHVATGNRQNFIRAAVVLGVLVLLALVVFRHRLARGGRAIWRQLLTYRRQPVRLSAALLSSVSLTLCNVLSFWLSAHALGVSLAFISALIIFTLGIVIGTAIPTPGGLGGVEAGLVAGLVAFHVPAAQALAVALVYRLISYWLVLVLGGGLFVASHRRKYL
ncbi:MAG TPA: lysylphosphatidylglycerol synthase transmembrane domain-containing protein [Candidatus Saccharimonadales bacterium]|nr:lysylphosphatidylglycerol synthase transmembrane domain-containing protein [Candidatus Saccharimonadales bacterium]